MTYEAEMMARREQTPANSRRTWEDLCGEYLPVVDDESIWRYSRVAAAGDPDQGWKLHVSATILNAPRILKCVGPALRDSGVQFKAARTLDDVQNLNSGLRSTYTQIGKIITVYPRSDDEAVLLARRLHQLTYRFKAPAVPFDLRLQEQSNVYYRYGAFRQMHLDHNGSRLPAVISPHGKLVPDLRENPKPDWVCDPFRALKPPRKSAGHPTPDTTQFLFVRALVQRGKGGVYQAIDIQSRPPRLCLVKEGRKHGEMNWDGRDGAWRVQHEQRVLAQLRRRGISVPQVYSRFQMSGNVYLAMEFIDGESLHQLLLRQTRRLPLKNVLSFGIQIAALLAQLHRAGWAWRDCKPNNLIVNRDGRLVPIDFEGAERIDRPDPGLWGTPGFVPQAAAGGALRRGFTDDLFSLGSILFLLITGQMFDEAQAIGIVRLRRNTPSQLRQLVELLLSPDPAQRPSAEAAQLELAAISRTYSQRRQAA